MASQIAKTRIPKGCIRWMSTAPKTDEKTPRKAVPKKAPVWRYQDERTPDYTKIPRKFTGEIANFKNKQPSYVDHIPNYTVKVPDNLADYLTPKSAPPPPAIPNKYSWQDWKPATMDEIPVPQGSWQAGNEVRQKLNNTVLFFGIIFFAITISTAPNFIKVGFKPWDRRPAMD